MADYISNEVYDGGFDVVATCNLQVVCSTQPTTRAEALNDYFLGSVAMSPADYTKQAGDASGRKITVSAKSAVEMTNTGTPSHFCLVDDTTLHVVGVAAKEGGGTVTGGTSYNLPEWDVNAEVTS